jgi:hypothetical protein
MKNPLKISCNLQGILHFAFVIAMRLQRLRSE